MPGVAVTDFFKPVVSEINRLARAEGYELRFNEVWSEVREERIAQGRKPCASDENILSEAERLIHQEFSCVLHLSQKDTVDYICSRLKAS